MKKLRYLVLAGLSGLLLGTAQAASPFELVATTTGTTPPITITTSANSLIDFTNSLLKSQDQFAPLQGKAFTATTTFLGVPNAITFNVNATATNVAFSLGPINYTKTFTGTGASDVNNQIEDFFKVNGTSVYAQFLSAIAKQSAVAVTDGNPNASTASTANTSFVSQGFTPTAEVAAEADPAPNTTSAASGSAAGASKGRFGGFGIGFNSGQFRAGGFNGTNTDIAFSGLNFGIGEKLRLQIPVSLSYITVEGSKTYGGGVSLVLPFRVKTMDKDNPLSWRVTPLAGVSIRGSEDLASGALLWEAGVINTFDYRVNPKLVVCFVDQLTFHKSIAIDYAGYHFDPGIDQQIVKNGLRFVVPLNKRLIGDFMVIDSRFLKDAAVKQFTTFGTSIAFRTTKSYSLTLGTNYDTGSNFRAWSAGLSSAWRW
jgi:hypothetical protein